MFYPNFGSWSKEEFDDATYYNSYTAFTVTGGYLSLAPIARSGISFTNRWDSVTGWNVQNNLNSESIIKTDFTIIDRPSITGQLVSSQHSGYAQHLVSAGAWNIRTEIPAYISGYGYSGQDAKALELSKTSPDTGWFSFFSGGGSQATIEVDVASTYDFYSGAQYFGFTTGQELLTGLNKLSGLVGQGIYIDNGAKWDFIEVSPFGIRSINHPDIAIDIDLSQPKRIRLGLNSSSIYLSTEDGRGVAGTFDTNVLSGTDAKILFGAPPLSGTLNRYPFLANGISGFVGETLWDNIKILLGKNTVTEATGQVQYYTTSTQTIYTPEFDPGIPISLWSSLTVEHTEHKGGTTAIKAQYSGANSTWIDAPSSSILYLTGQSGPSFLDLSSIPIFSSSRNSTSHSSIKNPIRLQIQMTSNGVEPPPAIGSLTLSSSSEDSMLDLLPNWKPINQPASIQMAVISGRFYDQEVVADQYTTFLLNTPNTNFGVLSGTDTFKEQSIYNKDININGIVEQIVGNITPSAIRNIVLTTGRALTGSQAATVLGTDFVDNYFFNSDMEAGFAPVSGDPAYVYNRSFGELALGLKIIPTYTGRSSIQYSSESIYRPENDADINRINSITQRSLEINNSYVQAVYVPGNSFSGTHDNSCGLEIVIPSGIASSNLLVSFDLQVPMGTGLYVYATGSVQGSNNYWTLKADNYRNYNNVSFPLVGRTGSIFIGLAVPSGTPSSHSIQWNVDNIVVAPYNNGYVYCNNVPTYQYQSGLVRYTYTGQTIGQPIYAGTSVSMHSKILAYPTGTNNSIINKKYNGNDVFNIYLTNNGLLGFNVYQGCSSVTAVQTSPTLQTISGSVGTITDYQVPLGRWQDIGLVHQATPYLKLGQAASTGSMYPDHMASCNRVYLTVGGSPVGVVDLQKDWSTQISNFTNPVPLVSRLFDGSGTVTIGSGILMDFDGVKISRPVVADAEIDQSIKYSKVTLPYFVPDVYFKPGAESGLPNVLTTYVSGQFGPDFYMGSIYNFDGPGYTNWDHGPWGNHLLFYGSLSKSNLSPYTGMNLGSTYIPSGSYAIAKYSSTTERQLNTLYNLFGLLSSTNLLDTYLSTTSIGGWVYPHSAGKDFFKICQSDTDLDNNYISFGFNNSMNLVFRRKTSSEIWAVTGSATYQLSGWNWIHTVLALGTDLDVLAPFFTTTVPILAYNISGLDVNAQPTANYATMAYQGGAADAIKSCFVFGKDSSVNLADWFISPVNNADVFTSSTIPSTLPITGSAVLASKSGRYQALLSNGEVYNTEPDWQSFNVMTFDMPVESSASTKFFSMAMHNKYDGFSRMNGGMLLFDDVLFRNTESYYLNYDSSIIDRTIGNNSSPIKIGYQVPEGAVNLAKISSPAFTSESSLSIIDLSYKNNSNLSSFKDGIYTVSRNSGPILTGLVTGAFYGLNSGLYSGRLTTVMSGQVHSKDITVTSVAIPDINSSNVSEAFYAYLLGRGQFAIKVDDTYPHPTGDLSYLSSGSLADNYLFNLSRIKNSIVLKDSEGRTLEFDEYPYYIVSSPMTPSYLKDSIDSNISFNINGIGPYTGNTLLPDGTFTAVILTNKKTISEDNSVWAHYSSVDTFTNEVSLTHKEIINPIPIMRPEVLTGSFMPGRYSISYSPDSLLYSLNIFGVNSGYAAKL